MNQLRFLLSSQIGLPPSLWSVPTSREHSDGSRDRVFPHLRYILRNEGIAGFLRDLSYQTFRSFAIFPDGSQICLVKSIVPSAPTLLRSSSRGSHTPLWEDKGKRGKEQGEELRRGFTFSAFIRGHMLVPHFSRESFTANGVHQKLHKLQKAIGSQCEANMLKLADGVDSVEGSTGTCDIDFGHEGWENFT